MVYELCIMVFVAGDLKSGDYEIRRFIYKLT